MKGLAAPPSATLSGSAPAALRPQVPTGHLRPYGFEPPVRSTHKKRHPRCEGAVTCGGDEGARTLGLRLAKPALSQLSYIPVCVSRKGSSNNRPSGDSATLGRLFAKGGGPDKVRTCDLPVISRTL